MVYSFPLYVLLGRSYLYCPPEWLLPQNLPLPVFLKLPFYRLFTLQLHTHTHTIHRVRRRHSPSISVLAFWYCLPPTRSRCNDLTQIFINMEALTKYPQNWNNSIFQAPPPPFRTAHFCALGLGITLFNLSLVLDTKVLYTQHLHTVANKATAILCNFFPSSPHFQRSHSPTS
jgi:hypothetical protein